MKVALLLPPIVATTTLLLVASSNPVLGEEGTSPAGRRLGTANRQQPRAADDHAFRDAGRPDSGPAEVDRLNSGWVLDAIEGLKRTVEEQGRTIEELRTAVRTHEDTIADLRMTIEGFGYQYQEGDGSRLSAASAASDPRPNSERRRQQRQRQTRRALSQEEPYVPPHMYFEADTSVSGDGSDSVLESRIAALELKTQFMEVPTGSNNVIFENCNLHVRSGSGSTDGEVNGLGNLIVGYDEVAYGPRPGNVPGPNTAKTGGVALPKTGSHNIVGGTKNSYSSYGGLIVGSSNSIGRPWATVTGGQSNEASGFASSVGGGERNVASGLHSTVSGGNGNKARGEYGSVTGGRGNVVDALGRGSTVSGGSDNVATGYWSTVGGGFNNTAGPGYWSSVAGGRNVTARGHYSTVAGGMDVVDSVNVGETAEAKQWTLFMEEKKVLDREERRKARERWKEKEKEMERKKKEEEEEEEEGKQNKP